MKITCHYFNETYCKIECEDYVHLEIYSYLKSKIPDFHLIRSQNPRYRFHDGYKRFYQKGNHKLLYGHILWLNEFCKSRNYELCLDEKIKSRTKNNITKEEIDKFINTLPLPYTLHEYQKDCVYRAVLNRRLVLKVPTGSGKTVISYCIIKWFLENEKGKVLFVVPSKGLIKQAYKDFKEYGYTDDIHIIQSGAEKELLTDITISTWQSIYKLEKEFFNDVSLLIIDECHQVSNAMVLKSIEKIIQKSVNAYYRFGTTGTLKDEEVHEKLIEGMIGRIYQAITTVELIENKQISPLKICIKKIDYPDTMTGNVNKLNWHEQLQFIDHEKNPRQEYIIKLVVSLKGNTLVLFRSIEHGTFLYEQLVKRCNEKEVMYIDGSISAEDREKYRMLIEENDNLVLVASFGTSAVGISICRLHNIVFSSPSKSKIRVLQSIGRGLRKHETKSEVVIYDIVDMIGFFKSHYRERKDHYDNEKFPYTEEDVSLFSEEKL